MLAKHWCREYLRWRSVLAEARENVLVRRMRSTAWKQWNVPAVLAGIPAILEAALILFLSGVVVFLWTLEKTVAIVVTTVIGILLSILFTVIVAPALYPDCPYRSPVGWALTQLCILVFRNSRDYRHPEDEELKAIRDWRQRELYTVRHAPIALDEQPIRDYLVLDPSDFRELLHDSVVTELLLGELTSLYRGSDQARFSHHIPACLQHIHRQDTQQGTRHTSVYSTILALSSSRLSGAQVDLTTLKADFMLPFCYCAQVPLRDSESFRTYYSWKRIMTPGFSICGPFIYHWRTQDRIAAKDEPLLSRALLLKDLENLVDVWLGLQAQYKLYMQGDSEAHIPPRLVTLLHLYAESIALAICFLRCYAVSRDTLQKLYPEFCQSFVAALTRIYKKLGPCSPAYETGLINMVAELLGFVGEIEVDSGQHEIIVNTLRPAFDVSSRVTNYTSFAIQIYKQNPGYIHPDQRHLFVMTVDAVLRLMPELGGPWWHVPRIQELFSFMLDAARISLHNSYSNFGGYIDLPWLTSLVTMLHLSRNTHFSAPGATPLPAPDMGRTRPEEQLGKLRDLLSVLQASVENRLITTPTAQQSVHQLRAVLRDPRPSPPPTQITDTRSRSAPNHGPRLAEARRPHRATRRVRSEDELRFGRRVAFLRQSEGRTERRTTRSQSRELPSGTASRSGVRSGSMPRLSDNSLNRSTTRIEIRRSHSVASGSQLAPSSEAHAEAPTPELPVVHDDPPEGAHTTSGNQVSSSPTVTPIANRLSTQAQNLKSSLGALREGWLAKWGGTSRDEQPQDIEMGTLRESDACLAQSLPICPSTRNPDPTSGSNLKEDVTNDMAPADADAIDT
ncbi:hypothetical protein NM688_g452 [Phlebia brevispora]|uniref:Uncharacterized protein n=1 Tax=Phlebia brevispora TaxID=194682 RepID=A0ACC1TEB5_9APHY|nr:hypothetical protein NM688_g452 [Phlebia brevispora]